MKERGIMPQQPRLIQMSLGVKIFLCVLATVYLGYMVAFVNFLYPLVSTPAISEHLENANRGFWTTDKMRNAVNDDQQESNASDLSQGSVDVSRGRAAQRQGQL